MYVRIYCEKSQVILTENLGKILKFSKILVAKLKDWLIMLSLFYNSLFFIFVGSETIFFSVMGRFNVKFTLNIRVYEKESYKMVTLR